MTKLFYEPKRINERKGTEPLALVCMRFSCLIISMIILMVFFAFMVYSVASDGRITTSVIIPKPYIPIPDLVINANFSFSMDCQLQYLDGRAISQTDKDSCSNYIVPTVCNEPDPNDLSKGRCTGKFQVPTELLDAPLTERLSFSLPDKRYGIQFLINITDDVPYDPKYDNGIIVKAYDQEFNPHRLPEAVNNLISKIDPCFIDRLDSLNFHMLAHHQINRMYIDRKTREFIIPSFWEVLGIPPFYFLQTYINSRVESAKIPSIADQFTPKNYGTLFVGTFNWIEIIERDLRITTSVIIPKPYIPIPDLVINANFSFSMDCQLQYLDGRAISQTDKDSCSNYIVPTVCNEPDPNDLSKGRCTGKFQVPTELLDAPLTERLSFSLPDKRYGIQFLINITDDVPYDPKYDNGIIVKAYDQEFNPHRLPEAVNNLISKIDPCFIDRLDSLNFHMLAHHQINRMYIDRKTREFIIPSFWEVLGIPPFYFLQTYINSRVESAKIPSIADQFTPKNYGTLFVGWSAVMPWGICQRTCCSRKSKAKLSKKFAPKGVPLMPSTLDNDVDNLMKFLGLILLRSTNFSIKNDEENTSNSDNYSTSTKKDERDEKDEKDNISNAETSLQSTKKDDDDTSNAGISSPLPTKKDGENTSNAGKFLIKIKNKIKRENSVGQKVNMSNLQPSNSKNGKHDQTLDEQDGNPILTDKLPIDKDQFEDSPSGPEKEKLADKIIRKFSRKGKKSTNDPSNIKNDEDDDKIEVLQDKNGSVDVPEINPNQSDSSNNNSPGANPSEIELLQTLVNIVQDGDGNVIDVTKSSRSSMISPDELRKSTVFEDENASTIDVPETSRSGRSSIFTKDEDDNLINPDDVTRSISIVADENGNIINVPEANKSSRSSIIVKDEDGNVINLDDINPDDIRRGISIVEDENGNVINVPETNSSSRSSIIIKDEDGNVINLDDINPDDIRRSVAIVKDENGNIINVPGTNRSSRSSIIVKDEDGNVINLDEINPDDINPDDVTRSISIVEDENGNVINVPETNKSSRNSVIFKDEDGNMTNPDDDVNPEVVRRSISIVADENGNIINTPGTNRSSRSSIIVKDEDGNMINLDDINLDDINPDDINPDDIRRSIAIVKDENGNIINVPGTNRSSRS
ncbi:8878_t:CDS:10, partial [Entrophospora sp. SA101]